MKIAALAFSLCVLASSAYAQSDMSGMGSDMDMSHMDMPGMASSGIFGSYPMTRDASGTSWQPDAAEHNGVHAMAGDWSLMGHMMLWGIYGLIQMPQRKDPEIPVRVAVASCRWPGASAQQVFAQALSQLVARKGLGDASGLREWMREWRVSPAELERLLGDEVRASKAELIRSASDQQALVDYLLVSGTVP